MTHFTKKNSNKLATLENSSLIQKLQTFHCSPSGSSWTWLSPQLLSFTKTHNYQPDENTYQVCDTRTLFVVPRTSILKALTLRALHSKTGLHKVSITAWLKITMNIITNMLWKIKCGLTNFYQKLHPVSITSLYITNSFRLSRQHLTRWYPIIKMTLRKDLQPAL